MSAKKPKFGIVAICDAVYRDEASNKAILAGVYSGDILVESFPIKLRLAFYFEVFLEAAGTHDLDIQFHLDGKHVGGAKTELANTVSDEPSMLLIPSTEVGIDKPLELQVRLAVDGGPAVKAITKQVRLKSTDPSA